jgi:hypothetical protein
MTLMSKDKKPPKDRHKPRRMTSVPERVALALEAIGESQEAKLAEMVKRACIEFLEKRNAWPPKG